MMTAEGMKTYLKLTRRFCCRDEACSSTPEMVDVRVTGHGLAGVMSCPCGQEFTVKLLPFRRMQSRPVLPPHVMKGAGLE